ILDAISWTEGHLLLATDEGMRVYEKASGKLLPAPLPEPGRPVKLLCRDGLGRLWLAGEGLWMLGRDGRTLHSLDSLPMMGRTEVAALASDAKHADGIVASLGERGVLFVRGDEGRK